MTAAQPPVSLPCPAWCVVHTGDDNNRLGGGVTAQHESTVYTWSDDAQHITGIRRIDEYADAHLEGIFIANRTDSVWDISADEARRLADALLRLADTLERE
jgi:hypothetical protein